MTHESNGNCIYKSWPQFFYCCMTFVIMCIYVLCVLCCVDNNCTCCISYALLCRGVSRVFHVPFWHRFSNFIVHPFANACNLTVIHRRTTAFSSSMLYFSNLCGILCEISSHFDRTDSVSMTWPINLSERLLSVREWDACTLKFFVSILVNSYNISSWVTSVSFQNVLWN